MKFQLLIKLKYRQIKKFLALSLSDVVFIMLINVKMPTIGGILTFMRINFVLSCVEYEKFYNLRASFLSFFLTLCMHTGYFTSSADFFRVNILLRVSNNLDPDQDRHCVMFHHS